MGSERHAGFYTVSMVKAGHVDQWAADRSYGRIIVELKFDRARNLFVVTETVTDQVGTARRESTHHYLSDAHHAFTTLTRKHQ